MYRLFLLLIFISHNGYSQKSPEKIKIFIDCSGVSCDENYMRSEITIIDFTRENQSADIHILITATPTGGGAEKYQLIFYGQNIYAGSRDTLFLEVGRC